MNQLEKTRCLSVTFHIPGDSRKGSLGDVSVDADKSELRLQKKIFRSESFRKAQIVAIKTRQWIEARSLPSPLRSGTYLIPESLIDSVEEKLKEAKNEFNIAADAFCNEYPTLIENARERLRGQFSQNNYPTVEQMRQKFWMERFFLNFTPSNKIEQTEELSRAIDEIKAALRCGLLELINKLSGMLGEKKNGKKRAVTDKALQSFNEWIALLPNRLVVDDDELKKLVDQAKELMNGKSRTDFRDIESVRTATRKGLQEVGEQLRGLLKDMPSRSLSFDD